MSVNSKAKALLAIKEKNITNYAKYTNRTQANVSNKIARNSWNVQDFLLLAKFTNTKMAFLDENNMPIIIFNNDDIVKK